jgi:hypothetical protein
MSCQATRTPRHGVSGGEAVRPLASTVSTGRLKMTMKNSEGSSTQPSPPMASRMMAGAH